MWMVRKVALKLASLYFISGVADIALKHSTRNVTSICVSVFRLTAVSPHTRSPALSSSAA